METSMRPETAPRRGPVWPQDAVRIMFGLVWLVDAVLKWLPGFRASYMDAIRGAASGQPAWLHGWFRFWIDLQAPRATFFAYLVAVVETLIALTLIFGFARKLTYISAAVLSVLIWATAEGFGGPYTSGAADVGTGIVYALVFASLLVLNAQCGPARFSVDALIERRVPWWYRIAEVGHRAPRSPQLTVVPDDQATTAGTNAAPSAGCGAR